MDKLRRVLLVDDHEADNFLHRMFFEDMAIFRQVDIVWSGEQALEYLGSRINGDYPRPELICLDLNMPRTNGWEFLEAYQKLPDSHTCNSVIVVITTTENPDDEARTRDYHVVKDYWIKPLKKAVVLDILKKHFPERFNR